jgi:hypothetical protein
MWYKWESGVNPFDFVATAAATNKSAKEEESESLVKIAMKARVVDVCGAVPVR